MKNLPNIEKLPGKKHYTGYGGGKVWRIVKVRTFWRAEAINTNVYARLTAGTLTTMSAKLEAVQP